MTPYPVVSDDHRSITPRREPNHPVIQRERRVWRAVELRALSDHARGQALAHILFLTMSDETFAQRYPGWTGLDEPRPARPSRRRAMR